MSKFSPEDLRRLRRLFSGTEPNEVRGYLAAVQEGRSFIAGSAVPPIGALGRRSSGLFVPSTVAPEPGPLDFGRTYVTFKELTGRVVGLNSIKDVLRRIPLFDALLSVASTIAVLRRPGESDIYKQLDRDSIEFFNEPIKSRVLNAISQGATLHVPQMMLVLAKLIIAECPYTVPVEEQASVPLPMLLLTLGDNLRSSADDDLPTTDHTVAINSLALEIAANTLFNADFREDSQLALFMRRWIEMPRDAPSRYLGESLAATFLEATGFDMEERLSVVLSIWAGTVLHGPVVDCAMLAKKLGWDPEKLGKIVDSISLPLDEYKRAVKEEVRNHSLDWYFTTFSRYPLVKFEGKHLVVDPDILLRRCLGFAPIFEIEDGLKNVGNSSKAKKVRQAFNDYSEMYAKEVFDSLTGAIGVKRVYADSDLKKAYKGLKVADVAVDYGSAWVIVEVTTSQTSRDTVNGVSLDGLARDRDMVLEEVRQIHETINNIRSDERRLTGESRSVPVRFYPIVVLTEGFPNNPVVNTIIREAALAEGLLAEPDVAKLEIVNLVELDVIEGVSETHGPPLPEILEAKEKSAFHADSLYNFLIGDARFSARRPKRVERLFKQAFEGAISRLQGGSGEQ